MPGPITSARPLPGWLAAQMPFERRELVVHGDRMCFVDAGPADARAVLLVHGNPTWSYLWRKVIHALAGDTLRVIAPDLLGFGGSYKPKRATDHQLAIHIDRVAGIVEALGIESFVAVGQDMGGPVACGVGERLGDRLHGLVLGNTAVLKPARPFRPKAFHKLSRVPVLSDALFRGLLFPLPLLDLVQGDRTSIGWREKAAYAWPLRNPLNRAGALGLARMVPTSEVHPSTSVMDRIGAFVDAFEGPAALVWALRDPILGRGLRRHKAALPQASVRDCDAGHFSQEEVPELWAEAIREVAA